MFPAERRSQLPALRLQAELSWPRPGVSELTICLAGGRPRDLQAFLFVLQS